MFHIIHNVLNNNELAAVLAVAQELEFGKGESSAGRLARAAKRNLQAVDFGKSDAHRQVMQKLARHAEFRATALPERISSLFLSKYLPNMAYGHHFDGPLMEAGRIRTDIAFTLFLTDPASYDGGELEISLGGGSDANVMRYKLPVSSMIVYPAYHLHGVAPVTSGERLAIVGWVQSAIPDAHQREVIRELNGVRARLRQLQGEESAALALERATANLTRMWTRR
jgi:PKHD-type hydroxylase